MVYTFLSYIECNEIVLKNKSLPASFSRSISVFFLVESLPHLFFHDIVFFCNWCSALPLCASPPVLGLGEGGGALIHYSGFVAAVELYCIIVELL